MYDEFAHLWPLVSHHADYAGEAVYWRDALRDELGEGKHRILEMGVGGGNNLHHILYPECDAPKSPMQGCLCVVGECASEAQFEAAAVDLSEKMIANSRLLNPSVEHHIGDMRSVRLGSEFDAVLIHDAVCYMLTEDDIRAVVETARCHLRRGGVLIMAPDWFRETYPGTQVQCGVRRDAVPEFASIEYDYDPDPNDTTLESIFIYIIRDADGRARVEEDRHVTGIFSIETWLGHMRDAGFDAKRLPYPVHEDGSDGYLLVGVLS